MAPVIDLTQKTDNKLPGLIAALANSAPLNAPGADALRDTNDLAQSMGSEAGERATALPNPDQPNLTPDGTQPDNATVPEPIKGLVSGMGSETAAVPQEAKAPGFFAKLKSKLPTILNTMGVIGGGLEAAAGPEGKTPEGAEMFLGAKNKEFEHKIEAQNAATNAEYKKALASQYGMEQAGFDADGNPIYVQRKNLGQVRSAQTAANSREVVAAGKNQTALQVEQLRQGAPMVISPQMAQIAEQPELAGKAISGTTLKNFVTALKAHGANIKDLGNDPQHPGLWVVDNTGRFLHQLATVSPTIDRAGAYARARAENTFSDVFDANGNLTNMSEAERGKQGVPKAQTVFSQQGPTAASRTMAQSANTLLPHIDELQNFLTQNSDLVGPAAGRINAFLSGTVGSTGNPQLDQSLGHLRGDYKLFKGALSRTHFGGRSGVQAVQLFDDLMGAQTSVPGVIGILESVRPYIQGYSEMQNFTPQRVANSAPAKGGGGSNAKGKAAPSKQGDPLGIL